MKKLLIVEDNDQARKILKYYLSKYFLCEIFTASNGREGLDVIAQESPDVITLDNAMPVMDGMNMLEQLRLNYNDNTVVIPFTVMNDNSIMEKMTKLGVTDFINKPVRPEILLEKLQKYIPLRWNTIEYKTAS